MAQKNSDIIYADNNATTPIDPEVYEEMKPYLKQRYGNPNSLHAKGREANKAVIEARDKVASLLNSDEDEVVFTSCATESNNQAIKGTAAQLKDKGKHIITTKTEHKSILNPCRYLEKNGYEVTYLDVDNDGYVDPSELEKHIREDTVLITIHYANNEIGTIQPIKKLVDITPEEVVFHTDAAQVPSKIPIDVNDLGVDLLTINGHKMYGPKGIGALYINQETKIQPLLHGGGQENGLRSGTENVPYIVGLGKAAEKAKNLVEKESKKLISLHKKILSEIPEAVEETRVNGPIKNRLPGNANISFKRVEGEALVLRLEDRGIMASTGSACASETLDPSHVLVETGVPVELAHSSLRISLGRFNDIEDAERIIKVVPEEIERLRSISAV
ncbi:cysteine desulfurase family protein [Methanonatronarchaeum sp. AMET6-2]|uniref:cysteine desulfurase family protein n=1 Tax=Methanonatronarchaeum sp. AMET6-2 TaxID=2933293 RepID=UPI001201DC73|nr:cysteine desulfurase family protein [Methanonatronarchaeum sp. AMET6-2]RZN62903.1 MAG: cysteine desulfurase [Methanonatronarchaeia archaeon]UOY09833.1 cysteine desulfurase [Methanonatronarchaeum sp. AMET6-2]